MKSCYLGRELQGQTVCTENTPEVCIVIEADEKLCTSFVYRAMKELCSVSADAPLYTLVEIIFFYCVFREGRTFSELCAQRQLHEKHCFSMTTVEIIPWC